MRMIIWWWRRSVYWWRTYIYICTPCVTQNSYPGWCVHTANSATAIIQRKPWTRTCVRHGCVRLVLISCDQIQTLYCTAVYSCSLEVGAGFSNHWLSWCVLDSTRWFLFPSSCCLLMLAVLMNLLRRVKILRRLPSSFQLACATQQVVITAVWEMWHDATDCDTLWLLLLLSSRTNGCRGACGTLHTDTHTAVPPDVYTYEPKTMTYKYYMS